LSQALIALAMAQAEAEAEQQHPHDDPPKNGGGPTRRRA
jgi:hypothetical protein